MYRITIALREPTVQLVSDASEPGDPARVVSAFALESHPDRFRRTGRARASGAPPGMALDTGSDSRGRGRARQRDLGRRLRSRRTLFGSSRGADRDRRPGSGPPSPRPCPLIDRLPSGTRPARRTVRAARGPAASAPEPDRSDRDPGDASFALHLRAAGPLGRLAALPGGDVPTGDHARDRVRRADHVRRPRRQPGTAQSSEAPRQGRDSSRDPRIEPRSRASSGPA